MKKKLEEIDENSLKFEIAKELGLTDKIKEVGWAGLTAKESGRIGGIMTSRKKKQQKIIYKLLWIIPPYDILAIRCFSLL